MVPPAPCRRRQWHPIPVLLPGKSRGRRSLVGYNPWGHKELDTTERLNFDFKLPKNKEFPSYDHSSVIRFRNCLILFPGGSDTVKNLPAMPETQVQSLGWEDPLEKGMATHSGILAWRIPWMEEPGGLQSTGSQRVGHN